MISFFCSKMAINVDSESGQVVYILSVGLLVLLGLVALAIDGGIIYNERRRLQNTADSAALAGALQLSSGANYIVSRRASKDISAYNGFEITDDSISITGPSTNETGQYYLVMVDINEKVNTSFAHLLYPGVVENSVSATARFQLVENPSSPLSGFSIVALGDCNVLNSSVIQGHGGDRHSGIYGVDGAILINSPEKENKHCAIELIGSNVSIFADNGVYSVGSHDYKEEERISPLPVNTSFNAGVPVVDPLKTLPEPICIQKGIKKDGSYQPGNWKGKSIKAGIYSPGIYCIDGDIHLSGTGEIRGEGVLFYLKDGEIKLTGSSTLDISAPKANNCSGQKRDVSASCSYINLAIYMGRNNNNSVDISGGGENTILGTVYAPSGTIIGINSAQNVNNVDIRGQLLSATIIAKGNASLGVKYDPEWVAEPLSDAFVSLEK